MFLLCTLADIHLTRILQTIYSSLNGSFSPSYHNSYYTFFHDFYTKQFFAQVHLVDEGDHSYQNYTILTIATLLNIFCYFHLFQPIFSLTDWVLAHIVSWDRNEKLLQVLYLWIKFWVASSLFTIISSSWIESVLHFSVGFLCASHATYVFSN